MAIKKGTELKEANLSFQQKKDSIPKIDRKIEKLKNFNVDIIEQRDDPLISTLSKELESLLTSIFGINTVEYNRYHWDLIEIDTASIYISHQIPIHEVREGLTFGINRAIIILESIKNDFLESLEDAGETPFGKAIKAYEGLELHPNIQKAVGQLFRDGHYANAVEDSVKALNALVRLNSGVDDKDGTQLMEYVFNSKSPILKINNLVDESDMNEQKGFMMLFSGAVSGLRNPRAHKIIKDDPEMALEFIAFVSLLAKFVDKAKK